MSAEQIPIQIETKSTIHNNSQVRSNLNLKKRKNLNPTSLSNKKQKMSTNIDFEKFEDLNKEYENIFEDFQKTIHNLRREKKELYEDSRKIIKNLKEENRKLKEEKEETEKKFDESSSLIFFMENWFGQAFQNAKNLFYNYYYNNIEENIYIDHKTPLPTIFNNLEENSDNNYSSRMSTPDIYDDYEFDD
jgi:hypothetical protein